MRAQFSAAELSDVRNVLIGNSVTSIDDFAADLRAGGFVEVVATDLTRETVPFVAARVATWRRDAAKYIDDFGAEAYRALETFYAVIASLFANGSLGCLRVVAIKP